MNTLKSAAVMLLGCALAVLGGVQAFSSGGLDPNLRLVYGWSMMVVLGLFLVSWGIMNYVTADEPEARSEPSKEPALDTRPSAGSSAKRSGPSHSWYDADR